MLKTVLILSLAAFAVAQIDGGYNDVDVNSKDVLVAADFATKSLGKQFSSPYHTKLGKIRRAQYQIVAGANYKLDVIVGLTECKKAEVKYEDIESCEFQDNVSTYKKCTVVVYRDLKGNFKLTSSGCILATKDDLN